jgi:hypothetical protein
MGTKWGLEKPLTYWAALDLLKGAVHPDKGRPLNWGGLRVYDTTVKFEHIGHVQRPTIKKGAVELAQIHPQYVVLGGGHWRSKLALKVAQILSHHPIGLCDHMWYIVKADEPKRYFHFVDGVKIFTYGKIDPELEWNRVTDPDPAESVWPIFEKYIDTYVAHIGRGEDMYASAEGCWQCFFNASNEVEGEKLPKGSEPAGVTHLFEHAIKGDVEPSLLWRAMQENNLNPHNRWSSVVGTKFSTPDLHTARDLLTGFFKRRLGLLGAYHFGLAAQFKEKLDRDSSRSAIASGSVGVH